MGIGAYRHLVTLEHPAVETDPPTWYCALQPAGAQVGDGLAAYFIRGRFHPGITLETQINWEGRTFQVQGIADLDERHREIQITAVEVVGRGTTPSGVPVNVPPSIVVGPSSVTIDAGESVTLTVEASGAVPLFYQWLEDGADLPGMDDQFYVTGPLETTTAYAVRVSNIYGSVTSAPAVVTVATAYQRQILDDGASEYWPLDTPSGLMAINMASATDGTISGGVTLNQPGVTDDGTAMTFDGTTGKILTAAAVSFPAVATFEAWVKPANVTGSKAACSTYGVTDATLFGILDNHVQCAPATGLVSLAAGAWSHVVCLRDAAAVTFYVNGVLDRTVAQTHGAHTSEVVGIGASPTLAHYFAGSLQDVAIYPRALTPAEIAAHYALRVTAPPPSPLLTNLVSYWKLDEASGTRSDAHGTNHLTDNNTVGSAAGKIGTAGSFVNANAEFLSCASNASLQAGDIDFTFAGWFFSPSGSAGLKLITKDDEGSGRDYIIDYTTGRPRFLYVNGGAIVLQSSAGATNAWVFFVAWHDASANTLNIQVNNGTVELTATGGLAPVVSSSEFRIGADAGSGPKFDGLIDEVGFWKRLLTPAERTELYNAGAGKTYPFTP